MTPESPAARVAGASLAPVVALLVVALALRPQLAAIGPLADGIIADLGTSHAYVGLLTTIPVLCMGVFALLGPPLAHATGVRGGIAVSVGILVLFAIVRTFAPDAALLLLLTFGVGVGTGVVGPVLPMFVRGRLPSHMVAGTAAYAAGTIIGAAIGGGLAVPLADIAGGWRGALLVLSLASLGALAAWMLLVRRMPAVDAHGVPKAATPPVARHRFGLPMLPWRRRVAWVIGLVFGLQSWLYYGTTAWLANVYMERGWEPATAAGLLPVVSLASLVAIVIVPWLSGRGASRRLLLASASLASVVGLAGVLVVPDGALAWAILVGAGLGMTFTLALTLPTDIARDQREVGGAAAMMLVMGYLIASAAPFVLGAVRDATGDFEASLLILVVIAAVMVPLGWSLSPGRLRPPAARVRV